MVKFTKLFWHNTKNQKLKLFATSFIGFAILLLLAILVMSPFNLLLQAWQISILTGQQSMTKLIFMMIGAIILTICIFSMVLFPIYTGLVRVIRHSVLDSAQMQWKDLVRSFKKGIWGKSVILGLMSILFIILTVVIYGLVNASVSYLVQQLFNAISANDISQGWLQFIISILIVLSSFILSIFVWFTVVYVTNLATSLTEDASRSVKVHLKEAWYGIKNGHKTFLRFFIGILLLNLIFIIINQPINYLIQQNLAHISQDVAYYLMIIFNIIFLIIRYLIYLLIIGTIIQYFVRRGQKEVK
ncbi:lytic transglycosylase [Staphylococcus coagulans]|uniref:lytic transglycosylase n=1 Tax=Staphylococcus coagulans TaxID=74706 RepID=UPI0030EF7366